MYNFGGRAGQTLRRMAGEAGEVDEGATRARANLIYGCVRFANFEGTSDLLETSILKVI